MGSHRSGPRTKTDVTGVTSPEELATLVDSISNRLQVVLGFAQILHDLDEDERRDAVTSIARECDELRAILRTLTSAARDDEGLAPWQATRVARFNQ